MDESILFAEKQKFRQWWIWVILIGINGIFLTGLIIQLVYGTAFGDKPMSNVGLILSTGLMLLIIIMFLTIRLETIVKKDGIYVRFFPFQIALRFYSWENIQYCYIRTYQPIKEYGGYGIRYGFIGNGKALNISGNKGLQLIQTNDKKILIGTKQPDLLAQTLLKIGQIKNP